MARNQETELKFLVDDETAGAEVLPALLGRRIAGARKIHLETVYYDTPDRQLDGCGLTVRLRKTPDKRILSVKSSFGRGIGRTEHEVEIAGDWPSAKEWQAVAHGSLLARAPLRRRLVPLCTTAVTRTSVDIEWKNATIEASLDRGSVRTPAGRRLPVHELELELKDGGPADLFSFAGALCDRRPLRISLISKGARGFLLAGDVWACPQPAALPELEPAERAAAAFQDICMTCLRDFMVNEAAIAGPEPVEGVHKTRIAVRRLRSAMTLFRPLLQDRQSKALARELKWLSDNLGRARDLDVAADESGGRADLRAPGLEAFAGHLEAMRRDACRELERALRSDRCRSLLFDFVRWLEIGKWRTRWPRGGQSPIPGLARRLLERRLRSLLRDARDLAVLDVEGCHEIRKDAKKLRYMGEFFLGLARRGQGRKRYMKLLAGLEDVQKALGKLQDQVTLGELLRSQIAGSASGQTRKALMEAQKSLSAGDAERDGAQRKKAARAIRKIRALKPFRRGGPFSP